MTPQETIGGRGKRRKLRDGVLEKTSQDNRRALYHCNYCQKDISHVPRIKCAECKDFDLCLECFSVGVEIKPHKNYHDYQVVENLSFPIFHPDWGADEEILLLEAIDQYGLGNWGAVADHVGGKTPAQCRQHYLQVYIDTDTMPLPKPTPEMSQVDFAECIARARQGLPRKPFRPGSGSGPSGAGAQGADPRAAGEPFRAPTPALDLVLDEAELPAEAAGPGGAEGVEGGGTGQAGDGVGAMAAGGPVSSSKGVKRHRHELLAAEDHAAGAGAAAAAAGEAHAQTGGRSMHHEAGPSGAPAAGGKAPRGAWGPDGGARGAGQPPGSGKPGGGSCDATGFHLKRMEFDPEFDNEAECIVADMEFNEFDSPADVQQKLQMLALYNKRLDERERRRSFVLERGLLNTRAAQLQERRRNTQEKDLHARLRVFARYQSQPSHDELVEGLLLEARMRTRIAELREYRRNGIRTLVDAEVYDTEKRRQKAAADAALAAAIAAPGQSYGGAGRGAGSAAAKARAAAAAAAGAGGMLGPGGAAAGSLYGAVGEDGMQLALVTPGGPASGALSSSVLDQSRPAASVYMGRGAGASLALWRAKRGVPLDITCLPGVELLSARERELCAAQRLLPAHYLALKDMLMRDCEKNGVITRAEARTFFRLDPARSLRIYELLVMCGWVRASGPQKGPGAAGGPSNSVQGGRAITAGGETEGEEVDEHGDE